MADQDKNMNANKEEFTAFLHPEEYDHMKDIVVLVSIKSILTPVLNYEVNTVYFTSPLNALCNFFSLQETMEDIDKNGDGLIDLDEYIGEFIQPTVIQASSVFTT